MTQKRTKARSKSKRSAASIARQVGVSRQLISRKLAQGKSQARIVAEAKLRREAITARAGTNGKQAESFSEAQRRKEVALANKHETQLEQMRGALVPHDLVRITVAGAFLWLREERRFLPARLRDELHMRPGPDCERLLEEQLQHHLAELARRLELSEQQSVNTWAEWQLFCEWKQQRKEK